MLSSFLYLTWNQSSWELWTHNMIWIPLFVLCVCPKADKAWLFYKYIVVFYHITDSVTPMTELCNIIKLEAKYMWLQNDNGLLHEVLEGQPTCDFFLFCLFFFKVVHIYISQCHFRNVRTYFCVDRRIIASAFQPANHSTSWIYYLIAKSALPSCVSVVGIPLWDGIHGLISHALQMGSEKKLANCTSHAMARV